MENITLKDIAFPIIKAIDKFNYLLKSHHLRVAILSYQIGFAYGLSNEDLANLVVASAMHDIGALSVSERDMLIQEDVEDPSAHCLMAYRILKDCELFKDIAKILRHHHIRYDQIHLYEKELDFVSNIIHFADRIDIYLDPNIEPYLQLEEVTEKLRRRTGTVFHPEIFNVYKEISVNKEFWKNLEIITMEEILNKVKFRWDILLTEDNIVNFSIVISKIVDYRSHYTATHSYTVGYLAYNIGKTLNYEEEKCKKLLISGLLHDIGKIGINPSIIEKKEKLTNEEYLEIKEHTNYTNEILKELTEFDWFKDIVKWATNHHERVDGSGYPNGLSLIDDETIIIAYSDLISALMEDRPYRDAMSLKETMKVLKEREAKRLSLKIFKTIKKNTQEIVNWISLSQMNAAKVYKEPLVKLLG